MCVCVCVCVCVETLIEAATLRQKMLTFRKHMISILLHQFMCASHHSNAYSNEFYLVYVWVTKPILGGSLPQDNVGSYVLCDNSPINSAADGRLWKHSRPFLKPSHCLVQRYVFFISLSVCLSVCLSLGMSAVWPSLPVSRSEMYIHVYSWYFSFQAVLHDWCNKGRCMCYLSVGWCM